MKDRVPVLPPLPGAGIGPVLHLVEDAVERQVLRVPRSGSGEQPVGAVERAADVHVAGVEQFEIVATGHRRAEHPLRVAAVVEVAHHHLGLVDGVSIGGDGRRQVQRIGDAPVRVRDDLRRLVAVPEGRDAGVHRAIGHLVHRPLVRRIVGLDVEIASVVARGEDDRVVDRRAGGVVVHVGAPPVAGDLGFEAVLVAAVVDDRLLRLLRTPGVVGAHPHALRAVLRRAESKGEEQGGEENTDQDDRDHEESTPPRPPRRRHASPVPNNAPDGQ